MKLKLSQRFTIYIGAVMLAGISLLVYSDIRSNTRLLYDIGLNEAERISAGLFDELYQSMKRGGGREENRAIIERYKKIDAVDDVRVIHGASIDKEHGMEADEMPVNEQERAALEGRGSELIEKAAGGHNMVHLVRPLFAEKECLGCHAARVGDVNGVISVKISLKKYEGIVAAHTRNFFYWGGGIFILTCLSILYIVHDRLLLPIDGLKKGAQVFASGDLDYRLGIHTGDEFEETARDFEEMASSLMATNERLAALNERHFKLVQMAADAIFLKDRESDYFVDANPAAVSLVGYSLEELKSMKSAELYPPERVKEYGAAYAKLSYDGRGYIHDAVVLNKSGSQVPVEIAASVIELDGREFVQEIWRDLSERKGFEKVIKSHVVELEETVKRRTEELRNSLEALEDAYGKLKESEQKLVQSAKLISLGEMGAGIAHELNSPLAGILSITEVLLGRLSKDDPNYMLLEKMKDAAVRSKYIIIDMLVYARPTKQNYEPMYMNESVRATLCLFTSEIKSSSVKIEEDFDLQLPMVYGNKGQIMEVLLNIIKNARDAMEGTGTIYISTWSVWEDGKEYAVAEITDTGPGISQDVMANMFDPFFSTKEKGGGHNIGLGLSISQSIIKEHHGRIEVESSPKGATFRVFVPLYTSEQEALTGEAEAQLRRKSS